jgi:hypothetical protein
VPVYVCRKCGANLSVQVERALEDEGPGVMGVDVVVEGSLRDDMPRDVESFLARAASEGHDELIPVVVTCPTDDIENTFLVRRKDN